MAEIECHVLLRTNKILICKKVSDESNYVFFMTETHTVIIHGNDE